MSNEIVSKLVNAMLSSLSRCESTEQKVEFLQELIMSDPPEGAINFVSALSGIAPEVIVEETRKLARAELEKLAN